MAKMGDRKSLVGQKIERLYVKSIAYEECDSRGHFRQYRYLCQCDCGKEKIIPAYSLKNGVKSCGCAISEALIKRNYKHGLSQTDIWIKYNHMKERCLNPNASHYERYGGRGISICDEWLGENGFENFTKWSYEHGYKKGLSLDRKDNDGNYTPDNCRWIQFRYQCFNRNNTIYLNGESVAQRAYENGLNLKTVYKRIKMGWSEDRLFIPSTRHRKVAT